MQTCSSVFGLIGLSGRPGRAAEILAYTAALPPHYGEDWGCLSQHAFALCENGDQERVAAFIDRPLALNPRNANGAHVRSHGYYETGEPALGLRYPADWLADYDRAGYLHGHLSWHCALWALKQSDAEAMWRRLKADIQPGAARGLPINMLTDTASLLYRAEMAGVPASPGSWTEISRYAGRFFPKTGIGFIDIHSAPADAMAGEDEPLRRIMENPNPTTGDLVTPIAGAWRAMARRDWSEAADGLTGGRLAQTGGPSMSAATHLAQFNWSTLRADPGAPEIAEFVNALDRVHAIAERSAGFVWRLGGEAEAAKAIGWPMFLASGRIIASLSVWRDAAALERFVYRTVHGAYYRRGRDWFEPGAGANLALWTVPRGHIPDIAEARERVEHLIAHGPTERAFDFAWARRAATGGAPAARETRGETA